MRVADPHTGARYGEVRYDAPENLRWEPAFRPLPRILLLTAIPFRRICAWNVLTIAYDGSLGHWTSLGLAVRSCRSSVPIGQPPFRHEIGPAGDAELQLHTVLTRQQARAGSRHAKAAGALALASALLLGACATRLGPRTIPAARFDYNERIARSQNDQLLLNLVRLRYRDTPVFLDVGAVIAQYTLDARVGVLPKVNVDGGSGTEFGVDLGGRYGEQPTITYQPITGAEFTQRLLTPISPQTLVLLSQSGWSIERLLMCCVDSINSIANAPVASGPTPSRIPNNSSFREVARLLRELQLSGMLHFLAEPDQEIGSRFLQIRRPSGPTHTDTLQRLRELLQLSPEIEAFRLTARRTERAPDEIVLTGRSLLGTLFFLSHSVAAPATHEAQGFVTVAKGADGEEFDWSTVTGNLLRISSGTESPENAFVRIRYRNHWFYIEDSDLNTKATFNLLTYLLSLQSAGREGIGAMLTVPVGQ